MLTLNKMFNTFLSIRQRVQEWASHPHCLGTKTQGFDDIRATPDAAIEVNF
jgi:hypothetical protein